MVVLLDEIPACPNIKKRLAHGDDVFVRARDFYRAHEDMRKETLYVTNDAGELAYALCFKENRLEGAPPGMILPTYVNPYWEYDEYSPRMDLTYLRQHDAYLFHVVDEYSCFMARLIRNRFPQTPAAFTDGRIHWFVPDVEVVDSAEAFLQAHPDLRDKHVLSVGTGFNIGPVVKDVTYSLSSVLMASVFWASEETCFGERNPDKVFYLIKPEVGESGLAKFLEFTVGFFDVALGKREAIGCDIIPVVDTGIPGDQNQFNGGDGHDVWEMFFEPLGDYPLEKVYDSAHVIVSQEGNVSVNPYLLALKRNPNVSELIGTYVRFNEQTQAFCEETFARTMPENAGRVLGVVGRGTDFNNPTIVQYRQRPLTPSELLARVRNAFRAGGFDHVFLATEDQRVFDAFMQSDLGDKVLCVEQPRYDLSQGDDVNKLLIDVYQEEGAEIHDGYADTLRYLSVLYILSTTDALVGSTECGATIFAEGFKQGDFEFVDIHGKN